MNIMAMNTTITSCPLISIISSDNMAEARELREELASVICSHELTCGNKKAKAVPLHAMEALGGEEV
jgi:hypothetical protein